MKKYIQPSIKVREIELASMIASSPEEEPNTGFGGEQGAGNAQTNSHRGWNLWGVED